MIKKLLNKILSQPILRIQILSFLIVAFLPIIFVSVSIYNIAWQNERRELREKHQLLAENLASPLLNLVTYHRNALSILADDAREISHNTDELYKLARNTLKDFSDFQCIYIVNLNGKVPVLAYDKASGNQASKFNVMKDTPLYRKTVETGNAQISGVMPSNINSIPVIMYSQPVRNKSGALTGVIIAEMKTDEIVKLQQNIHFGKMGHCAIVDQFGHILAHPNHEWMKAMHDFSKLSIVKAMMAGKTGVMEFYSPYVKENMVAGYASVPGLHWGVMVPQPKSEVTHQVHKLMETYYLWVTLGAGLAILLTLFLVRWITRPINLLSNSAKELAHNSYEGSLPEISENAPREIMTLTDSMSQLVDGLQMSRKEIKLLNESLQVRIDEATNDLLKANTKLERLANSDHLTALSNRRYFENALANNITGNSQDLNILLIDIDYFKSINDRYGHAAGDAVLVQLSDVLAGAMREDDVVARYGGDEIVVQLKCSSDVARERAETLRRRVEEHEFSCNGTKFHVTISVGLLCNSSGIEDIDELMNMADEALYRAKHSGRNVVFEYTPDH